MKPPNNHFRFLHRITFVSSTKGPEKAPPTPVPYVPRIPSRPHVASITLRSASSPRAGTATWASASPTRTSASTNCPAGMRAPTATTATMVTPSVATGTGPCTVGYRNSQKHESTLLHMYVLNGVLTADHTCTTKYY